MLAINHSGVSLVYRIAYTSPCALSGVLKSPRFSPNYGIRQLPLRADLPNAKPRIA